MDLIELDRRAGAATSAIIDQVPAGLLDAPTPCTKWTVWQIIEHMVENNRAHVAQARDESEVDIGIGFARTGQAFTETFRDPATLTRQFTLGKFPTDGRGVVAVHLADVLVHGWDIGRAAGIPVTFDTDLARVALRITEGFPDGLRGPDGAFARALPAPDDAPIHTRLLAFLGRDPEWTPAT
ncbi:MAG: TIGR03086 family protein [Actinophytocola sp.]|uniref:TIGR03086 family metal-binding protein n=1 Tax=Actinophytocola sp. TaxID=1872138 RepID=UPI0013294A62|nr:TIGR03086 family metal-binding protein [Actinophytocola sp.]MPZ82004.1 TIGR03086 family protein [Actinophytocola sp.]